MRHKPDNDQRDVQTNEDIFHFSLSSGARRNWQGWSTRIGFLRRTLKFIRGSEAHMIFSNSLLRQLIQHTLPTFNLAIGWACPVLRHKRKEWAGAILASCALTLLPRPPPHLCDPTQRCCLSQQAQFLPWKRAPCSFLFLLERTWEDW